MRIFGFSAVTILHFNLIRSVVSKSQYLKISTTMPSTQDSNNCEPLVRKDGLKINYDPYAPEMVEKYGAPGMTDDEGFNPYTDSVGPGIYGGRVKRNVLGEITIGSQYQGHNSKPGPVYAGGGYTPMSKALRLGPRAIRPLLERFPDLVNEISTGGATPLHMCGMGGDNQGSTEYIIEMGGTIEAKDTYDYRPLHRMASNNLAIGAEALLKAGADLNAQTGRGETAMSIAKEAGASEFLKVLEEFGRKRNK